MSEKNTSLGMDEKVEALLAYLFGWITGIIFLLLERKNNFVRFHAIQSIVVFLGLSVIAFVAGFLPVIGGLISMIAGIASLILWVLLMIKAFKGEKFKVKFAGDIAEKKTQV